jgi:hypothetical protein
MSGQTKRGGIMEKQNGIIKSVETTMKDGFLTVWLNIELESGFSQSFGGFNLYKKRHSIYKPEDITGQFISRVMEIAGVLDWNCVSGKSIRVFGNHTEIRAIGHIIKEDWFFPATDIIKGVF